MNRFSYKHDVQQLIEKRELVEFGLQGASTFGQGYILKYNDDFITITAVNPAYLYSGTSIFPTEQIEYLSVDTSFLREFAKRVDATAVYQEALQTIQTVKDFTFDGFISCFEGTQTYLEIATDEDSFVCTIVGHDETIVAVDEYSQNNTQRIAHSYYPKARIKAILLNSSYAQLVQNFLKK
ncbi:MAG: hypothetical protein ABI758_07120 [Candidatus Woesebacteria bacterium]